VPHPLSVSKGAVFDFFDGTLSSARPRSLLLIAVRPRNFAIRCLLLYFPNTPALPFTMVAPVPAQITALRLHPYAAPRRFPLRSQFSHIQTLRPSDAHTRTKQLPSHSRRKSLRVILLQPLCRRQKSYLLWNQANPRSFAKTPGWGYLARVSAISALTLRSLRLGVIIYPRICPSFVFILLQIPFPATLLFSHPCKTPGGVLPSRPFYSCRASSTNPRYNRAPQLRREGS